ncbi:isoprenyl transferase [Maritalea porphyrae]|jgi:undecaprenyl diphosphate synthase|uniref:isoprenyl transferase n=1 Tax=Maritalea porphyrae TaxID=880732 RepID=UPI0022AEE002|nr:isoprenyl transferase [Maritalea porphyrae]MCZ4273033.1 isoprenyl transferase [Maritalea porphyrae]
MDSALAKSTPLEFTPDQLPVHIGVIMDGNGRWAQARGKHRTEGHRAGVEALRRLITCAVEFDIKYLTIFSFSSENWQRPADEVNTILGLMKKFVASDVGTFVQNNVRVRILGSRVGLNNSVLKMIDDAEQRTQHCTGLQLNVAFNYGARSEMLDAAKSIAAKVASGEIQLDDIDENLFSQSLYTTGLPDPDVIFRTSGEQRLSNFLLWQAAYSEFVFSEEYWPDFDRASFLRLLDAYTGRKRRFGCVG